MIHEIFPHTFNNQYSSKLISPETNSLAIFISGRSVLLRHNNSEIELPRFSDLKDMKLDSTYLFSVDNQAFYWIDSFDEENENYQKALELLKNDGFEFEDIMGLRLTIPSHLSYAAAVAHQTADWYLHNRFCGKCGKPLKKHNIERMMQCDNCKNMVYPKICPAVIVAVCDGDRLLLTKYNGGGFTRYALIAGFNEIGESIEETVKREVLEEVGVKVKNLKYYKSQPWPFTDTLLFGFFCELDGSDKIVIQEDELSVAEWVKREDIPDDDGISLTYEMMGLFKRNFKA